MKMLWSKTNSEMLLNKFPEEIEISDESFHGTKKRIVIAEIALDNPHSYVGKNLKNLNMQTTVVKERELIEILNFGPVPFMTVYDRSSGTVIRQFYVEYVPVYETDRYELLTDRRKTDSEDNCVMKVTFSMDDLERVLYVQRVSPSSVINAISYMIENCDAYKYPMGAQSLKDGTGENGFLVDFYDKDGTKIEYIFSDLDDLRRTVTSISILRRKGDESCSS